MATAAMLVRASDARRILDLGSGFGYSALWLAHAAGPGSEVVGVDRFEEHVHEARRFAAEARLEAEITFVCGEVASVLDDLDGDFDLVHDDAWFASAPDYYEQMVTVLRPGGVLSMPNWFLMEDAVSGQPRRDWSTLAGDQWAQETIAYAERLARDPRLHVTWVVSPPLGVGIKKRTRTARGDTAR
jgi:predicted O-methyltransferase YrrM